MRPIIFLSLIACLGLTTTMAQQAHAQQGQSNFSGQNVQSPGMLKWRKSGNSSGNSSGYSGNCPQKAGAAKPGGAFNIGQEPMITPRPGMTYTDMAARSPGGGITSPSTQQFGSGGGGYLQNRSRAPLNMQYSEAKQLKMQRALEFHKNDFRNIPIPGHGTVSNGSILPKVP